jgi:hypothetical protein
LFILAFMALRSLPPGAYDTIHWMTFVPHVWFSHSPPISLHDPHPESHICHVPIISWHILDKYNGIHKDWTQAILLYQSIGSHLSNNLVIMTIMVYEDCVESRDECDEGGPFWDVLEVWTFLPGIVLAGIERLGKAWRVRGTRAALLSRHLVVTPEAIVWT